MAQYVRQLAAQATMSRGDYDQTGEEGGFRANIRDADKQRHLGEAERIVKTEETKDRLIATAEADLAGRPDDPGAIDRLGKLLLERGKPQDEGRAHALYMHSFEITRAFRWREIAGEVVDAPSPPARAPAAIGDEVLRVEGVSKHYTVGDGGIGALISGEEQDLNLQIKSLPSETCTP